ncbi:MAG TPA: M56 family metallopeptidase [Candidatus Limnocylindria bacterium]|nr:M56 family metallopeptidase [Candidatus Limnocylindria bacterium]
MSLPLAVCALLAARTYARAAVRYRFLVVAFALGAAFMPLALLAAALRPAVASASPTGQLLTGAEGLAPLVARAAAAVAGLLLLAFALDVARVLLVKRRAVRCGSAPVRHAGLRESAAVFTPTAIGYLHPAVVVPSGFRSRVDAGEWAAVLAHECAHLARGDDWAKALQSLVLRAGWWLPGLWVLGRALDLERELASDERAAATSGPRPYAACLLRLATDRCGGLTPAFAGRRSHVAIRVERLLRPPSGAGPVGRGIAAGLFTATALAVVAGALVAVPRVAPRSAAPRAERRLSSVHAAPRPRFVPHALARRDPAPPVARPSVVRSMAVLPARHVVRTAWRPRTPRVRGRAATAFLPHPASRRPCATCFGAERLAQDALRASGGLGGAGPSEEATASEEAVGEGTMLWIRSPVSAAYP